MHRPNTRATRSKSKSTTTRLTYGNPTSEPSLGPQSTVVLSGAAERPASGLPPPMPHELVPGNDHPAPTFRQRLARRLTRMAAAILRPLMVRNRRDANIPQEPHPEREPPDVESAPNGIRPSLGPALPVQVVGSSPTGRSGPPLPRTTN